MMKPNYHLINKYLKDNPQYSNKLSDQITAFQYIEYYEDYYNQVDNNFLQKLSELSFSDDNLIFFGIYYHEKYHSIISPANKGKTWMVSDKGKDLHFDGYYRHLEVQSNQLYNFIKDLNCRIRTDPKKTNQADHIKRITLSTGKNKITIDNYTLCYFLSVGIREIIGLPEHHTEINNLPEVANHTSLDRNEYYVEYALRQEKESPHYKTHFQLFKDWFKKKHHKQEKKVPNSSTNKRSTYSRQYLASFYPLYEYLQNEVRGIRTKKNAREFIVNLSHLIGVKWDTIESLEEDYLNKIFSSQQRHL